MSKSATLDVTLNVSGMKCGGCENNLTAKLTETDGIEKVEASHKEDIVNIEYDATKTSMDAIKQKISDAGFTVEEE
jgi:copper chaperone